MGATKPKKLEEIVNELESHLRTEACKTLVNSVVLHNTALHQHVYFYN